MFLRRKIKPEWQAITDAQARQISEARASQATAREDFLSSMQRLSLAEALDLLTAHYAGQVSPDDLHDALQRAEHGEQPYWALVALITLVGQVGIVGANLIDAITADKNGRG